MSFLLLRKRWITANTPNRERLLVQMRESPVLQPAPSSDGNETKLVGRRYRAEPVENWGGVNVLRINQRFQGEVL